MNDMPTSSTPDFQRDQAQRDQAQRELLRRLRFPWNELLEFPKFVDIETFNMCNADCIMCGIDFAARRRASMSDELFEKIALDLAAHADYLERVGLSFNNEPLLDRRLEVKIARLKTLGIRKVFFITNASLLTEKRSKALLEAGVDAVYISLDSIDPTTFETIRVGLKFHQVYRNARDFLRLKSKIRPEATVRIAMVLQSINRLEGDRFVEHWKPFLGENDQVVVTAGFNWGTAQQVTVTDTTAVNSVPCISLWSTCVVQVNGDVSLCCADEGGRVVLGNLRQQTIREIWHGPVLQAYREKHLTGHRAQIPLCDGCAVWAEHKHVIELRSPGPVSSLA